MTTTTEPDAKRLKMSTSNGTSKAPVIGTHNGRFHADEALAVHLLRLLPAYSNSALIRTRDPETLKTCDVVVDVGAVHDHSVFRYDHHQREFTATFPGHETKLSSAGLVWMHHGRAIVAQVTGVQEGHVDNELLYQKLYDDFIEAFDANDNGIDVCDPAALRKAGIAKRFSDKGFSIAGVVNRFNYAPSATSKANGTATDKSQDQEEEDARFLHASEFVGNQFDIEIHDKASNWLPARTVMVEAFAARSQYDAQGRILVVPKQPDGGLPWADHLYTLERENGCKGQVLYVLFADNGREDSSWRIRAVSLNSESFENRKDLPEAWKGVRDEQLSKLSGIPGCIFIHASGFIGANKTFEGALEMAKKAVGE